MFIYIYIHIYVHIYVYTYIYMYVYIYIYRCAKVIPTHRHTHTNTQGCTTQVAHLRAHATTNSQEPQKFIPVSAFALCACAQEQACTTYTQYLAPYLQLRAYVHTYILVVRKVK